MDGCFDELTSNSAAQTLTQRFSPLFTVVQQNNTWRKKRQCWAQTPSDEHKHGSSMLLHDCWICRYGPVSVQVCNMRVEAEVMLCPELVPAAYSTSSQKKHSLPISLRCYLISTQILALSVSLLERLSRCRWEVRVRSLITLVWTWKTWTGAVTLPGQDSRIFFLQSVYRLFLDF